jgi:ribosomal protein L11 methylase PrmA
MSLKIQSGDFTVTINHSEGHQTLEALLKSTTRPFTYELEYKGQSFSGSGIRGDDALWIPYSNQSGLKIFGENDKYSSLDKSLITIEAIQQASSYMFPQINSYSKFEDVISNCQMIFIDMENVNPSALSDSQVNLGYVPSYDREFVKNSLKSDLSLADKVSKEFKELDLNPEDEWYKSINCINGKIVDFHRFEIKEDRYYFPSNDKTPEDLNSAYMNMIERYKSVLDNSGLPKWKGKIYQGMTFDNGYTMEGYRSTQSLHDSFRKLPFVPINKSRGKKVLDLGSNQGFFCFQAALHGATEVTGVELQTQDHEAANDIRGITGLDNVSFVNGDATKFIEETQDHYGLIVMNSVLHQIYKNFEGSEDFMANISKKCDYFAFETPLNHPLMNISAQQVEQNLQKYFKNVRLLYVYDAYSSGYRANYVCFS